MLAQFKAHLQESALAPATIVNYLADLRAFLRWSEKTQGAGGDVLALAPPQIRAYCSFLQEEMRHAPATVNRRLQALRKFYAFAAGQGWTGQNPADEVALMTESVSPRSRLMTGEDVDRLLSAVRKGRPRWAVRDWAIIHAFLGAGLKLSELTDLRTADVFLESEEPSLRVRSAAGEPERTIPLDAVVSASLSSYLSARRAAPGVDTFFVNRDGRPLSTRSVQRLLRHYAQAADLEELTTQALRYLYARRAYELCSDAEQVARLLGHRHLATTIRYLRPGSPPQDLPPPVEAQAQGSVGNTNVS